MFTTPRISSIVKRIGLPILGLIIIGLLINQFVVRPKIVITAPLSSQITVSSLSGTKQLVAQTKTTQPTTTLYVNSGDYKIMVASTASKELYYSPLHTFETKRFSYSPSNPLTATTVERQVAYNVIPSGDSIDYLNTSSKLLESVDQNGTVSRVSNTISDDGNQQGSSAAPAAGDVQTMDVSAGGKAIVSIANSLYVLNGTGLTPIAMPPISKLGQVLIATNPAQTSFAVSVDKTIYWYSSVNAQPQEVIVLSKRIDQLAYGGTKVIAYSNRMPEAQENIRSSYAAFAIDPIVVDVATKAQTTIPGPIVNASLSPDGLHAVIEPQSSTTSTLYDLITDKAQGTIESSDLLSPLWTTTTDFVYSKGSAIWKLNSQNFSAELVSTLPNNQTATSLTYDPTNSSFYATTYNDELTATIYRLSTMAVDPNAERAAALDTSTQSNQLFNFHYLNITAPTLIVTTTTLGNQLTSDEFQAATLQSRQLALTYLQKNNVDSTQLRIVNKP